MRPQILPVNFVGVFLLLHGAAFIFIIVPSLSLFANQHLAKVRGLIEGLAVNCLMRFYDGWQVDQP